VTWPRTGAGEERVLVLDISLGSPLAMLQRLELPEGHHVVVFSRDTETPIVLREPEPPPPPGFPGLASNRHERRKHAAVQRRKR